MRNKTSLYHKSSLRVLFAGTPAIAVPSLNVLSQMELEGKGIALVGLLTNPDAARRRGQPGPSDASAAASRLDVTRKEMGLTPIVQLKPEKLDGRARERAASLSPDLLISFAYGRIFGPRFLALFPLGGINVHPSLLPRYRGPSPIPAVILAGEKETGICIQRLAAEMDAGDIIVKARLELSGRETARSLSETCAEIATYLLAKALEDFEQWSAAARPQEGEAVYCHALKKADGLIDWNKSAVQIDAQIRAYTPWPLSFTHRGKDTLIILEAEPLELPPEMVPGTVLGVDKSRGILIQTGDGILAVSRLQWQTKKALDWNAFCNGERDFTGVRLG